MKDITGFFGGIKTTFVQSVVAFCSLLGEIPNLTSNSFTRLDFYDINCPRLDSRSKNACQVGRFLVVAICTRSFFGVLKKKTKRAKEERSPVKL